MSQKPNYIYRSCLYPFFFIIHPFFHHHHLLYLFFSHSLNQFYNFFKRRKVSIYQKMCNNMAWSPSHPISGSAVSSRRRHRSKQSKLQIYRLSRKTRCEENEEKDMELMNLKLYLENQSIIEENEKLRKKADLLHQENLALMTEFQKKFPHLDRFSATLLLLLQKH